MYQIIDKVKSNHAILGLFIGVLLTIMNFAGTMNMNLMVFAMAAMIGAMVLIIVIKEPIYAYVLILFCNFFLFFFIYRVIGIRTIPLGFVVEGLNFLSLFILFFKGKLKGRETLVGTLLLLWLLVSCIELFNPFAASRVAWFHAIRSVINSIIPFFVLYSLFLIDREYVKKILYTWIVLSTFCALYTMYQEFAGFPPWDYKHVTRSPEVIFVIYTFGRFRKIGFFAGPMENGIILAFNAVICLGLAFQQNLKVVKKIGLIALGLISAWGMVYTGTRTATVIFVLGMIVYLVLSRNKELILYSCLGALLLVGYIAKTGGGHALSVMATSFDAEEDNSMQVRYDNQLMLRKYLKKSPIGFGLGSTGHLGRKYSPNTFLGSFPPDSELVRIVIETGVIGLGIWLLIYYLITAKVIDSLKVKEDDFYMNLKYVFIACIFMFLVGQFPQEIMKIQSNKVLFAMIVAFVSLPIYDKAKGKELLKS